MSTGPAHLFVTRGDLTRLACDAWLLPTDRLLTISPEWRAFAPSDVRAPADWGETVRTFAIAGREPTPYATDVGSVRGEAIEWYLEGVRQFVRTAAAQVRGDGINGRERALLALPMVGTGAGGAQHVSGAMVKALVADLADLAREVGVDVALVTFTPQAFAAAQAARRELSRNGRDLWPELDDALGDAARHLGAHARAGDLVLFIGAGVSMPAGLPSWTGLLDELAEAAGFSGAEQVSLRRLNPLDRAALIERRLGREALTAHLAERFTARHVALAHTLLAALPTREAVTTNYDDLFESARHDVGRPVAVIPYEAAVSDGGWLLKLHGSADRPDDIVLSRVDYLSYDTRRAALAGIVQALLITRHMLFIGFSLGDDNFHRIVHEVRQATGQQGTRRLLGTAVILEDDPLQADLWTDLSLVAVCRAGTSTAASARRVEILLDRLLFEGSDNSGHLLDPDFEGVLTQDERALRDLLTPLAAADGQARAAPAWARVRRLLDELGQLGGERSEAVER